MRFSILRFIIYLCTFPSDILPVYLIAKVTLNGGYFLNVNVVYLRYLVIFHQFAFQRRVNITPKWAKVSVTKNARHFRTEFVL